MSEWSRKLCETDAEQNTFEKYPSKENWDIYAKSRRELDMMGCCENMWVALSLDDIVKYGGRRIQDLRQARCPQRS